MSNPIGKAIDSVAELGQKEYDLRKERVEQQHLDLADRRKRRNAFKDLQIGTKNINRVEDLKRQNREYIEMARLSSTFMGLDLFRDKVPMFGRNIILLGAETGVGKSTTCANAVLGELRQGRHVTIITNEENIIDILNRIVFLTKGWAYTNHKDITEEQIAACDLMYPNLLSRMEIIDDNFNDMGGTTTTLEGIVAVCEFLLNDKKDYGTIIIDYVQNIKSSTDMPTLEQWRVLDRLGAFLDSFKNAYDYPVILLSQLKAGGDQFKDRIEKFKAIMNHVTTAIEIISDKENLRTEWIFRKSRFNGVGGQSFYTGYDKGRYVEYTQEFMTQVRMRNEKEKQNKLMSKVFKKE